MRSTVTAINLRIWHLMLAVVILAALYFLQDLLVPVAVAALITFLLSPLADRLQRVLGRFPAAVLTTAGAFILIGAVFWITTVQLTQLAAQLPTYRDRILSKLSALNLERTEPVMLVDRAFENPSELLSALGTSEAILSALGTAGAVVILALYMVFKRDDLRDRVIALIGYGRISDTTSAMREASRRVYRYLRMQFIVNITYGIPVAIGLHLIGVPNAALWGILAFLLRFIPYVGPLIAMSMPIVLSFAITEGWEQVAMTVGLFVALELISNNLVEPWLYGSSTGISSFALILAALFWTWLWGLPGLFLSTPLTVCLLVMGKHVPQLSFFGVVLSDARALSPAAMCYHRLLAKDQNAVMECLAECRGSDSLEPLLSATILPALAMIEDDARRGTLDQERQERALSGLREAFTYLSMQQANPDLPIPQGASSACRILCVAADTPADELTAEMLSFVLQVHGFRADHTASGMLVEEVREAVCCDPPHFIWICSLNPRGLSRARQLCRALDSRQNDLRTGLSLFHPAEHVLQAAAKSSLPGVEKITSSFEATLLYSESLRTAMADSYQSAPTPDCEADRLDALVRLKLLDWDDDELFGDLTGELTRIFKVPIALVSLVDAHHQIFAGQCGLQGPLAAAGKSDREVSVCGHVVALDGPIVAGDLLEDPRFAGNPFLRKEGLRFYAGVPLRTHDGYAIGSLCILDYRPRVVEEREVRLLQLIANNLMKEIERRSAREPTAA